MSTVDVVSALEAMSSSGVKDMSPRSFSISHAILHHGSGAEYPIGNLITDINMFEDIEGIGVTGWITLTDNINIFQAGPIIGHELLYLKFETGGATDAGAPEMSIDYSEHPLFVYKVENMETIKSSSAPTTFLKYRLHFCSTEMAYSDRIRISKTYQGTISDIIEDVLTLQLKTKKPYEITETQDLHHLISPNLRPLDLIADLTKQAQGEKTTDGGGGPHGGGRSNTVFKQCRLSDYLFYEQTLHPGGHGGFVLSPAMNSAEFPKLKFTVETSPNTGNDRVGGGDPGYMSAMLRSPSFTWKFLGDKLDTIPSGVWAAKHIRHNSVTKNFKAYKSDYLKQIQQARFSHLSETPIYEDQSKTVAEFPDAKIFLSSSAARADSNVNNTTKRADYPWDITPPSASLLRRMQLGHLFGSYRIEIVLPGNAGLSVGQLARAQLPPLGRAAGQPRDDNPLWENRLNNVWVITKISHHINTTDQKGGYFTKIEMSNTMSVTSMPLPSYGSLGG